MKVLKKLLPSCQLREFITVFIVFYSFLAVQIINATDSEQRYDQTQSTALQTQTLNYLVPSKLSFHVEPASDTKEAKPFNPAAEIRVYTQSDEWCQNLGTEADPWIVEAVLSGGDSNARLVGTTRVSSANGTFNFTDLSISLAGTGYMIAFTIVHPSNVTIPPVSSGPHNVQVRAFTYEFKYDLTQVFEYAPFHPPINVTVLDADDSSVVETGWAGRTWKLKAELFQNNQTSGSLSGTSEVTIESGVGKFDDLSVSVVGSNYHFRLSVNTDPSSVYSGETTTDTFSVAPREFTVLVQSNIGDCNDTIVCGMQPAIQIRNHYPESDATNLDGAWSVVAYTCDEAKEPVQGTTTVSLATATGHAQFNDLKFANAAQNLSLCFNVTVSPTEPRYSSLRAQTSPFHVNPRMMCLREVTPPSNTTQNVVFATQPVLEVVDCFTGVKTIDVIVNVTAALTVKPQPSGTYVLGNSSVVSVNGDVNFVDLKVDHYGEGMSLTFSSPALSQEVCFYNPSSFRVIPLKGIIFARTYFRKFKKNRILRGLVFANRPFFNFCED